MRKGSSLIGRKGEPLRAVTFAGGGFATCLQLGVTHALLVSRGEAPDVVVGISAGAMNAVALAEVLQTGQGETDPDRRLVLRVERFRSVFESYQSAPSELLSALLPDSLQIDTQRPLEPLKLPIHADSERKERDRSLHSRSGLVNVYNELLALGLPIGTIARAARRYLGLRAIGEERELVRLLPTAIEESLPFLDMVGANLHRLAPLVPVVLPAALLQERKPLEGASAGELIFQAKAWEALKRAGYKLLSLAGLLVLWLAVTLFAIVALVLLIAIGVPLRIVLPALWSQVKRVLRWLWLQLRRLGNLLSFRWVPPAFARLGKRIGSRWTDGIPGRIRAKFQQRKERKKRKKKPQRLTRLVARTRSGLEWIGDLWFLRWLAPKLRGIGYALSFRWVPQALDRLGKIHWLEPASEALKRLQKRIEDGMARRKTEKKRKKEAAAAGEKAAREDRVGAAPPRVVFTWAGVGAVLRTWTRLALTLGLRWLAWMVPVVLLLWLTGYPLQVGLALGALLIVSGCCLVLLWRRRKTLLLNFLERNALANGLLDPHPLRQLLVRLFDPDYYGKLQIDTVVENAMADSPQAPRGTPTPYRLSRYSERTPPIRVGVAAGNVQTGELETLPEETPVIEALLAATAVVPLFPSQRIDGSFYVDGTNIANEPTRPLLKLLRERIPEDQRRPRPGDINPRASVVHMYAVSPLPISKPELGLRDSPDRRNNAGKGGAASPAAHWPLVDVVERALELQRFRDASLERQLTELYTRSMPADGGLFQRARPAYSGDIGKSYLRTWVYPIEPQRPVAVNNRLMRARSEDDRRRIIAETVADGCRAALEAMIQPEIRRSGRGNVRCRKAIEGRLAGKTETSTLPGSDSNYGPGLVEVCRHCALTRAEDGWASKKKRCRLVAKPERHSPPTWPVENGISEKPHDKRLAPRENRQKETALEILDGYRKECERTGQTPWPRRRDTSEAGDGPLSRPTVTLLFSGGVFRGVYQLGVLNALSEIGLRPDIVAGASVGSITAAMAARVFATADPDPDRERELRIQRIRRLAATYMAIDRLVLTDRFADFVRTTTVRAAETRFSLRQADRVVRQYDRALPGSYERQARVVLAGLERLLYISPFEFKDLLEALRLRRTDAAFALIKRFFQELLDRGGVGEEVLGSEPLEMLITEHVLEKEKLTATDLRSQLFHLFLEDGIFLLATATNLTRGRLEIFGEHQLAENKRRTSLIQGLLASSAFPGVFRPRWSWEVMPHAANQDLFIDGGVMDNLPLDAAARFLMVASDADLIEARPRTPAGPVPHLLFSASLQEDPLRLSGQQVKELAGDWPRLRKRTKRLSYNQKLDIYERAQQAVRRIWGASGHQTIEDFIPLDLEVVTVRPRWLCDTFAFHPMLGFRRHQQARSIAHGCASTLIRLDSYRRIPTRERWASRENWGVRLDRLPELDRHDRRSPFEPVTPPERAKQGYCWFRPDQLCPFSRRFQSSCDSSESHTLFELNRIHEQCGQPEAHAPQT